MSPSVEVILRDNDFPVSDITGKVWNVARPLMLNKYWNGEPAPDSRQCEVRILWSEAALHVRFDARQEEPLVVFENPDVRHKRIGLWERDVCELFIGPDAQERRRYSEFEVAPTGEWLYLIVDWANDDPRDWEFESGLEVCTSIVEGQVVMTMRIPWYGFGDKPSGGDVWFRNLFRQVGSGETRGYLAWSPTMTETPQFHVPEKFGEFWFG